MHEVSPEDVARVDADVKDKVQQYGYTIMGIFPSVDDDQTEGFNSFCYTVGLYETYGFEICTVGLSLNTGHGVLTSYAELLKTKPELIPLTSDTPLLVEGLLQNDMPCEIYPLFGSSGFAMAKRLAGRNDIPCYQLTWPDPEKQLMSSSDMDTRYFGRQICFDLDQDFIKDLPIFIQTVSRTNGIE